MLRITDGCAKHNGWFLLLGYAYPMVQITLEHTYIFVYLTILCIWVLFYRAV